VTNKIDLVDQYAAISQRIAPVRHSRTGITRCTSQGKPILVGIIMVMPGLNEGPTLDDLFLHAKGRSLQDSDTATEAQTEQGPGAPALDAGEA
jgi:hypothetical protein